jgi:GNAT superfamily N-acetyltransferase
VSETFLLDIMFRPLRATARLIGAGAEANRVLELDGVTAAIVPSTPDRSVVNSVVYEHAELLEAALGTLADAYDEAGVRAWTVWTHLYLARQDGEPASMVLVHDHEGDCFWFAATVPAAQRRGLTSGLLHRALTDARARECETSTTQATSMGRPVYARLGYRDLGPVPMYERRKS